MANEKRLIPLQKRIIYAGDVFNYLVAEKKWSATAAADFIKEIRTIDAVEVVRCKDCKYWGGVTFGYVCSRWSAPISGFKTCTKAEGFCADGERKDKDA